MADANPFDQFDADKNPFDQFDKPSAASATPAPSSESISERAEKMPAFMRGVVGAAEGLAQQATGAVATPIAGLAGLASGLANVARGRDFGEGGVGDQIRSLQERLTYEPRTRGGQAAAEVYALPGELLSKGIRAAGDVVRGDSSGGPRDLLATTMEIGAQAAPLAFGAYRMGRGVPAKTTPVPTSPRESTFQAARREGLVVNPNDIREGGPVQKLVTGEATDSKINTSASLKNAPRIDAIARRDLGIPPDAPLTPETFSNIRANAGGAYEAIKRIGTPFDVGPQIRGLMGQIQNRLKAVQRATPTAAKNPEVDALMKDANDLATRGSIDPESVVESVKYYREVGRKNFMARDNPNANKLGEAQLKFAEAMENEMVVNLQRMGRADLADNLFKSRQLIAKTYNYEKALSGENIDARSLASQKKRGAPLSGGARLLADFGENFPNVAKPPSKITSKGLFTKFDIGGALVSPRLAAAAAIKPAAKSMLLSDLYQNSLIGKGSAPTVVAPGFLESLLGAQEAESAK